MILKICNEVIKYAVYALAFLVPLFWLPITVESLEFNKQYLLFIGGSILLFAWLTKMMVAKKKVSFRHNIMDWPVIGLVLVTFVSALFSVDQISSWLGFYGRFSNAIIGLFALIILYFVLINNFKKYTGVVRWFLGAVTLSALITGVGFIWPQFISSLGLNGFSPTAMTLEGFAVFLAASFGLVIGLFLSGSLSESPKENDQAVKGFKGLGSIYTSINKLIGFSFLRKAFYLIFVLISLIVLVKIDFLAAWIVLGVSMLIFLAVAFWIKVFRQRINLLMLPIIILLIAMVGLLGGFGSSKQVTDRQALPKEAVLDFKTTSEITWQGFKENPVLGSGPGTFVYNFSQFKPADFNQKSYWDVRFNKAPSQLMEDVSTTGALGVLGYVALIGLFGFLLITILKSQKDSFALASRSKSSRENIEILMPLILPVTWLGFLAAYIVYWQNTALAFGFWLFLGLTIASWQKEKLIPRKKLEFDFEKWPEVGLVLTTLLLILGVVFVGLFYVGGKYYIADAKQKEALADENINNLLDDLNQILTINSLNEKSIEKAKDILEGLDKRIDLMKKSTKLNNLQAQYRINLSQVYLNAAKVEAKMIQAGQRKTEDGENNNSLFQKYAQGAISQAKKAVDLSPNLVKASESLAVVYRDFSGIQSDFREKSIESFEKAIVLEPTNPLYHREICQLYLNDPTSDDKSEQELNKMVQVCQKAIDLKPTYLDAYLKTALVYEKKQDLQKAIEKLEDALDKIKGVQFQPGSDLGGAAAEIYFQKGRMQKKLDQIDQAIKSFEQAVASSPEHSNALFSLGLAYEEKGMYEEALSQFKKVEKLNPNNQQVKEKIQQIQRGSTGEEEEENNS